MAYVTLAIFLLFVGAAMVAAIVWAMAHRLLRPPRMSDAKALAVLGRMSPDDLGLPFEPMNVTVRDAGGQPLRLAGWWMPAEVPSGRTVILIHGYADAKVGAIAWAPVWRSLGWNCFAVDLRAHGESEGRYSTGGFFERDDLSSVIDGLQAAKAQAAVEIALFGVSLGAAVACGVAAKREDLTAVVLDSPFDDFRHAVGEWAHRSSVPLPSLSKFVCRAAERISGADFAAVRPVDLIPTIRVPLLVITGGADTFLTPPQLERIRTTLAARPADRLTEHAVFPQAGHNLALASDPAGYRKTLAAFLALCRTTQPAGAL